MRFVDTTQESVLALAHEFVAREVIDRPPSPFSPYRLRLWRG